jgi:3,4-dihydroxy 2-butanone 4-phosphate synthase/GTP cyclohydrolase II
MGSPVFADGRAGAASQAHDPIELVVEDVRAGRPVIIAGPLDGRGPAVLMTAAQHATAEVINLMARSAGGLVCLCVTGERWEQLGLRAQPRRGESALGTAFGVSIEAREGVTTGISAADRARTIAVTCDPSSGRDAVVSPGHVVPVRASDDGVLGRRGQAEAAVELARLAALAPAGVICEVIGADGSVASPEELLALGHEHGFRVVRVDDLVTWVARGAELVRRGTSRRVNTASGAFEAIAYREPGTDREHLALLHGDQRVADAVVRRHVACLAGEAFGDPACGCGARLGRLLEEVAAAPRGILLYLVGESRWHAERDDPRLDRIAEQILGDLGGGCGRGR